MSPHEHGMEWIDTVEIHVDPLPGKEELLEETRQHWVDSQFEAAKLISHPVDA
jgi:hypothetical protein